MTDENKNEEQATTSIDQAPPKVRRERKSDVEKANSAETVASRVGRKMARYTHTERTELLQSIEGMLRAGTHKLRDAIKSVGIGEQTYYNWKKSAEALGLERPVVAVEATTNTNTNNTSDDFQDLVKLEKENQRLRKVLAEKLRAENAELRKKLGLE